MDRPTILLAVTADSEAQVSALERAGFEPITVEPTHRDALPPVDLAVIDCDIPSEAVLHLYQRLHEGRPTPTLLLVGENTVLPDGVGAAGDEVALALKPIPAEALVYRLQALLIRTGRHLPDDSASWAADSEAHATQIVGEGHVVSVFAPKGGVGKTTIAVNMAVALRMQTRAEVLLFDADVGVGNVTSVLDVPYRMGLADLADSPPEEWTDVAFEQLADDPCRERRSRDDLGQRSCRDRARHRRPPSRGTAVGSKPPFVRHRRQPSRLRRPHHGDARGRQ